MVAKIQRTKINKKKPKTFRIRRVSVNVLIVTAGVRKIAEFSNQKDCFW